MKKAFRANPLINSGAAVGCDVLMDHLNDPKRDTLHFVNSLAEVDTIEYRLHVFESERRTGFTNYELANLMKSFDNLNRRSRSSIGCLHPPVFYRDVLS